VEVAVSSVFDQVKRGVVLSNRGRELGRDSAGF